MPELHTNPPAESQTLPPDKVVEASWTTRVEPELTRPFAVEELHQVFFEPDGWPGRGSVIALLVPECELQTTFVAADGEPIAVINRPAKNKSVRYWLKRACERAAADEAFIFFSCDTEEQASWAARRAAKLLPNHRRMSLERVYEAAGRNRGRLS
jgi:hypothetical protein